GKYRNSVWFTFTSPACCHPFVNRAEEMPSMVATLRGAYAHHVGEPCWEMFIRDLREASAQFAALWADHEVGGYGTRHKIFQHPTAGLLDFKTMSMGLHSTPGARMVVYLPADDATTEAIRGVQSGLTRCPPDVLDCGHRFHYNGGRDEAEAESEN
ncbi:MAG: hypothetical protein ACRDVE_18405, partial [Actinocrinis sp.]